MSPKERFLISLLNKQTKERWVAVIMLSAPPEILKTMAEKTIFSVFR